MIGRVQAPGRSETTQKKIVLYETRVLSIPPWAPTRQSSGAQLIAFFSGDATHEFVAA